jgi:hypothetical protein
MSTLAVNAVTDANGGNTATINSMTPTADSLQGFRNRIINGDMRIDQRNAGASVTVNAANIFYAVDRFQGRGEATDGVFTIQSSTTAPTGFNNSLLATVTTADASIGASQQYFLRQNIEGFNVADLGFGTAAAKTVTLSFVVRSSVTGTFSGSLMNGAANRSYPFTYTISAADTFETKSVTIAGDTSGTWLTDNSTGLRVFWSLGAGSSMLTTANAWAAGEFIGSTSSTNLIATNGATFYITAVQLEVGSVATPFERRPYGLELMLCQRYYYRLNPAASGSNTLGVGRAETSTIANLMIFFPTVMRVAPSALEQSGTAGDYAVRFTNSGVAVCSSVTTFSDANTVNATVNFTVSSGLTGGQAVAGRAVNTNAWLAWSAEL